MKTYGRPSGGPIGCIVAPLGIIVSFAVGGIISYLLELVGIAKMEQSFWLFGTEIMLGIIPAIGVLIVGYTLCTLNDDNVHMLFIGVVPTLIFTMITQMYIWGDSVSVVVVSAKALWWLMLIISFLAGIFIGRRKK